MKEYNLLIIGAGPAGIAPLFHMDAVNRLDDYIDKGICIIERSNEIGVGKFKDYNISANTLCKTFLEIFYNKNSDVFKEIQKKESYIKLLNTDGESPMNLCEIGLLYKDYGEIIRKKFRNSSNSNVFCNSEALEIKEFEDNYCVQYKNLDSGEIYEVFGKNIIINLGGEHKREIEHRNIVTVHDLLTKDMDDKISDMLKVNGKVVLIGNSHSAMSIISTIKKNPNFTNKHDVSILGRNPIKLYYETEELAKKEGYNYDKKKDVCHITNRVNRYSGMREESFFTAREIIRNQMENIQHYIVSDVEKESLFLEADIVIECTGYQTKMIPVRNIEGKLIQLAYNKGTMLVNKDFNIVTEQGEALKRIFSYGLGVGMPAVEEIGGEKSFTGRIDGVWLYQHFVAPKLLVSIEKNA